MRVLFVQDDIFRSQGVMILSALLKQNNHDCDILIQTFHKDLIKEIFEYNPDVICFSLLTTKYNWFCDIAKMIKKEKDIPIVVGGPHPTFFPEMIEEYFVDYVCIGEGEFAIKDLLEAIYKNKDTSKIKNIWTKKNGKIIKNDVRKLIEDLDKLPWPDITLYEKYSYFKNLNVYSIVSGRGCPYNCSFCFNKKYNELYKNKGKIIRRKSVDQLIKEIKYLISKNKKINYLIFEDDDFLLASKNWLKDFFQKYKSSINLDYGINARANSVNENSIKYLKKTGCHSIRMGLESADPYIRESILKKQITNEQVIKASKLIKNCGIKLQIYHILGNPTETTEKALNTYEFSKDINPTNCWCSLLHPYPGTEIMDIVKKYGLVDENIFINFNKSFFKISPLNLQDRKEIINLQKLFQFGNILRIPRRVMRYLIKLPNNLLYDFIFKITYGFAIKKMDNYSWINFIKTSYYSRRYY